ncbi:MAG: aldehyde dehydrogenase family protein [Bacteroidota bacterium]
MQVNEDQIRTIVRKVLERVDNHGAESPAGKPMASPANLGKGVFPTIEAAIEAATAAFSTFQSFSLEKRKEIIEAMRQASLLHAEELARNTVDETGLGRVEDKILKIRLAAQKTPGTEDLQALAFTGDHGFTLLEWAPWGVIGSITPVTNASETVISNGIGMLAGGNTVVFNPHPNGKKVTNQIIQILNEAIIRAGGPANLLCTVAEPTIQSANTMMKHPGIRLLVVTGGPGVVAAAMNAGKKVIAAGPGNPPTVVDETADIPQAARHIYNSAGFDNNIICALEKEIIAVASIADRLKEELKRCGAYEINESQTERLMKVILKENKGPGKESVINKDYVGKNANFILKTIGIDAPDSCRIVLTEVNRNHPLVWTEQLMPVIPIVRVRDVDEAIELAKACEHGYAHTATMHSLNIQALSKMARVMNCSIFVKNGPAYGGLGFEGEGFCSYTIASPTGEGVTAPHNFVRLRRCVLKDSFRIV